MTEDTYRRLAERLDSLPEGFPATDAGVELRLLARLFSPEQAALAAQMRHEPETPAELAGRSGGDVAETRALLKSMARAGLVAVHRTPAGLGYGLLPFAVGFYENQNGRMDAELAQLVEAYFQAGMGIALTQSPPAHRVVPVQQAVALPLEVHPAEAAADIVNQSRAWGVVPCICRQQKALIGEPCGHPLEVCLVLSLTAGAFDRAEGIRALSREEALGVLATAADAGLVHTVSNSRRGLDYICSCCTCSCGILRGMAELGRANVVARSAFVNRVDPSLCTACGACAERCSFSALQVGAVAEVDGARCTGCGVCLAACQQGALSLARRPDGEVLPLPETKEEWGRERLLARGLA